MPRRITSLLAFTLFAEAILAADPDPRSMKGVFGQLQPHGELVNNAFIGLYAGRTDLHFGQPMRVRLFTIPATKDGPYVHPYLEDRGNMKHYYPYWGENGNTKLELTDDKGKAVPYRLDAKSDTALTQFTLWPTEPHSAGVYWKPGTYRLKATVTMPKDPPQSNYAVGTFHTNEMVLTVRKPGAAFDKWDGKGELRKPSSLTPESFDDVFLYLGGLDEASSERLREQCRWEKTPWRVAEARFAPVTVPQNRKLTDDEVKELIADLDDIAADVRIRAVRGIPPTAPAAVITAALNLLTDDYKEWRGQIDSGKFPPVQYAAVDAFAQLGPVMIEPLIVYADRRKDQWVTNTVIEILGRIGSHKTAEDYFRRVIKNEEQHRYAVQQSLAAWGKSGVPLTREILATPGMAGLVYSSAIALLGKYGDAKTDGPAVRKQLGDWDATHQAATTLRMWKYTDALPDFERLLQRPASELHPSGRSALLDAFVIMAEEKTSTRLLHTLLKDSDRRIQVQAASNLAARKDTAGIPILLTELESMSWYTRKWTDDALRTLAGEPNGVGFDPEKPNPKLWRDYWAKKEKK